MYTGAKNIVFEIQNENVTDVFGSTVTVTVKKAEKETDQ